MDVTTEQIKRIKVLQRKLAWDDDMYRATLKAWFDVESAKELSYSGANECIKLMSAALSDSFSTTSHVDGVNWGWGKEKYECLGHREGFATPRELRMLNAMWSEVTTARTYREKDAAFEAWLRKKFHLGGVMNIKTEDVGKIKRALERMKSNYKTGKEQVNGEGQSA